MVLTSVIAGPAIVPSAGILDDSDRSMAIERNRASRPVVCCVVGKS